MEKLVKGILEFRRNVLPGFRETFERLALGQKPDSLFIACSDSRVVPNLFASTNPGDLFVLRNVGNLVPSWEELGSGKGDASVGAALEFSVKELKVRDIVVCGHSECGAMKALIEKPANPDMPYLSNWLKHGLPAIKDKKLPLKENPSLSEVNRLSQLNVLMQIQHLRSYPIIRTALNAGELRIHGWWFDIHTADVHAYKGKEKSFVLMDEQEVENTLQDLENSNP
ncbi:MAG TPA: carbonic anhydrase [bacterium]|nr:carbonic anhydrase [bacterium]